jgi:hypothetical protein
MLPCSSINNSIILIMSNIIIYIKNIFVLNNEIKNMK